MDFSEIKRLVKLVENSDIEKLEIQDKDFQISITKGSDTPSSFMPAITTHPANQPAPPPQYESKVVEAIIESGPKKSENTIEIVAPMVGTFYSAPSPDAEPYAKEGDEIHPGKILCIVEAMKLMNEIESEISGRIVKVLVENGQPVEYDQPLFLIEKS
jgi:acetyl-CoA carboxylase biotin carboxyl carrier protein